MDPTKPSPRIPSELILEVMKHAIGPLKNAAVGHSHSSSIMPFTASKALYIEARKLLKQNGSWVVPVELGRAFKNRVPPTWIRSNITNIDLQMFTRYLNFGDVELAQFKYQLKILGLVCPQLQRIIVTISLPDLESVGIVKAPAMNSEQLSKMREIMLNQLPPGVVHRGMRYSAWLDGEPITFTIVKSAFAHLGDYTYIGADEVYYLAPPFGTADVWVIAD